MIVRSQKKRGEGGDWSVFIEYLDTQVISPYNYTRTARVPRV